VGVVVRLDDPVARSGDALGVACWDLISERRPPEAGEHVLLELLVDADHPRRLRTVTDVGAALSLSAWSRPHLGWVVVASRHGELWGPVWSYIGFAELGVATPDGDEVSVWGRDFGRSPFEDWLVEMRRRELDASGTLPGPVPAPVAFTHEDFAGHVLDLLRDLHRPERLAVNPLVRSELVRRDGAGSPTEQLREAVVEAVARVEEDPPTERAARAVDRTYLRRGLTQEAAAEVLGMPFSTYRRHLARGLEAVVARLWAWELHGGRRTGST
jgi:DNA-directed RNA polymerase specialized sigma24 family protein